jgi:hypothetical protein
VRLCLSVFATSGIIYVIAVFGNISILSKFDNASKYISIKSLFVGGQVPPLVFILCFKMFLSNANILQSNINCSDD